MSESGIIPLSSPHSEYIAYRGEIDEAVARVLDGGWYVLGEEVAAFEAELATHIGTNGAVGVASGTDALELALRAVGVGPGDAVFTVSHTAVATVAAIERAGAIPVLVDVDPGTYTMDPAALEAAVADASPAGRLAAVVVVHLYGHPADMPAILSIAGRVGFPVIEDCAQAAGAKLGGRSVGTFGEAAAFSFYPTKNLGAFGDGGAVVSDNREVLERVRRFRQYGWQDRYVSVTPGINSRLDEIQAAILRVKLRHLAAANERRREIAARYDRHLDGSGVSAPGVGAGADHVFHQYVVRSASRNDLMAHLRKRGISTGIHYPVPIHRQPAYAGRLPVFGELPVTEWIVDQILSLPMFPGLSDADIERIGEAMTGGGGGEPGS